MNEQKLKKVSKSLSYVLRHRPDSVGLELSDGGWVAVENLLAAFKRSGKTLSRELLDVVVAENDKQRFEFSEDNTQIRARQGHSADIDLGYEAATPPNVLYHGTATKNLESIHQKGLIKANRHHVDDLEVMSNRCTGAATPTNLVVFGFYYTVGSYQVVANRIKLYHFFVANRVVDRLQLRRPIPGVQQVCHPGFLAGKSSR